MPNLHDIEKRIKSVSSTMHHAHHGNGCRREGEARFRAHHHRHAVCRIHDRNASGRCGARAGQRKPFAEKRADVKRCWWWPWSDRGLPAASTQRSAYGREADSARKRRRGVEVEAIACKKAIGFSSIAKIEPMLDFSIFLPTLRLKRRMPSPITPSRRMKKAVSMRLFWCTTTEARLSRFCARKLSARRYASCLTASAEPAEAATESIPASVEFEPEPADVLVCLRPHMRTSIYHASTTRQATSLARTAMHSATENANEMVETLSRLYNRVRQGAITTEISEIVGGAAALED